MTDYEEMPVLRLANRLSPSTLPRTVSGKSEAQTIGLEMVGKWRFGVELFYTYAVKGTLQNSVASESVPCRS